MYLADTPVACVRSMVRLANIPTIAKTTCVEHYIGIDVKSITALLVVTYLIAGCANPINLRTAARYADACQAYQAQNEWWKARMNCGRAATNAELGHASARMRAVLWYEYGRASGAICDYVEARRGLNTAEKLDEESGGPTFMSLLELARLELDQGKFKDSVAFFSRFESSIPKDVAAKIDAIGYAEALEEYARAAERAGNGLLSSTLRERSAQLRRANPGKSSNTDRTPYGKYCHQKS
jgi:tetratricopeptide (TPR) repeat protein